MMMWFPEGETKKYDTYDDKILGFSQELRNID